MKMKIADYIAQRCVDAGINQAFTVVGGGAMHLNDALGHQPGLRCLYQHHEQACAMAAEAYARIHNKIGLLCVTTGPGGTNAITGVVGGWLDSIPMLVLSGQVRYDTTARWSGVGIRSMGDQEFDIVKSIACMTKYSEMVIDPMRIRYCLEKALYLAQTGRPGPCWLDIPLNVQGAMVEVDELTGFDPVDYENGGTGWAGDAADPGDIVDSENASGGKLPVLPEDYAGAGELRAKAAPKVTKETARAIIEKIRASRRPVLMAGNGIRIANAHPEFCEVFERLGIPVVTGWNSQDCIYDEHPLYVGRSGSMGDRPGNFAVQNSDLVFSVGNRLSIRIVGFNHKTWARAAYVIDADVDEEELKKPSVHVDMPVQCDAKDLLTVMAEVLREEYDGSAPVFDGGEGLPGMNWIETCQLWKTRYPVIQPKHLVEDNEHEANIYALCKELADQVKEGQIIVVGNGSACVAGGQSYRIKKRQRFISNDAIASMGYDLPAAIGACMAAYDPEYVKMDGGSAPNATAVRDTGVGAGYGASFAAGRVGVDEACTVDHPGDIILLTGDGSIQMNLQELQTIVHHQMPIKTFLINNGGYHSIRQTQKNYFGEPLVGIGVDSYDLSFPDMEKLAAAYGIPYVCAKHNGELAGAIRKAMEMEGPVICEVFVTTDQNFEPKSAAKRLPDGTMVSPPLEDLSPFLPDEEMDAMMIIPRIK
jgi:acetolactate synthase-1/2/3 large subunit